MLLTSLGLIHPSIVKPLLVPTFKLAEAGITRFPLVPSKLNAWPTSPVP